MSTAIVVADEPASFDTLGAEYKRDVRPLLKRFCLECHSTEEQEGELDLERFATLAEVRRGTEVWLKVVEMLDLGEMPPEDSAQPSPAEREQLRGWVERYLHAEALAGAGDPGPVVLRRLTNAEYTYTIRDLTGVALDPAREFPTAGAAGEGFTNTGDALVMSPALLRKYLDAGKEIAAHAVLLPDGFRLSPFHREDEHLARLMLDEPQQARLDRLWQRRIEQAGQRGELQGWRPTLAAPNLPRPPEGIPQNIADHMRLMCDILVLAFQTDTTRVCTLKLNNDRSSLIFPHLDVEVGHHALSHSDRGEMSPDWLKVNQFFLGSSPTSPASWIRSRKANGRPWTTRC